MLEESPIGKKPQQRRQGILCPTDVSTIRRLRRHHREIPACAGMGGGGGLSVV